MDRNEINTFYHFQVVERFDTEAEAQELVANFLRKHNYDVEEQVTLPSGNRIDIIASGVFDGVLVTLPIEVKPHLDTASDFANAAFQAQSYSQELGLPVFIGPVMKTAEADRKAWAYSLGGLPLYQNGVEVNQIDAAKKIHDFDQRIYSIMSFMCRMNVGLFRMERDGQGYLFQTEPSPTGFVTRRSKTFRDGYKTHFRPKNWGMREVSGSNSRMKRFVEDK